LKFVSLEGHLKVLWVGARKFILRTLNNHFNRKVTMILKWYRWFLKCSKSWQIMVTKAKFGHWHSTCGLGCETQNFGPSKLVPSRVALHGNLNWIYMCICEGRNDIFALFSPIIDIMRFIQLYADNGTLGTSCNSSPWYYKGICILEEFVGTWWNLYCKIILVGGS